MTVLVMHSLKYQVIIVHKIRSNNDTSEDILKKYQHYTSLS